MQPTRSTYGDRRKCSPLYRGLLLTTRVSKRCLGEVRCVFLPGPEVAEVYRKGIACQCSIDLFYACRRASLDE